MGNKRSPTLWFGMLIALAVISVITPVRTRQARAQGPVWDLAINTVEVIGFEEDGRVAVLFVEVANLGLEDVPPSTLAVYVEGAEEIIAFMPIEALGPESTQGVEVWLELPEGWGGTERSFAAEADANNDIQEDFEDNNFASTGPVEIPGAIEPPPQPEPTEPRDEPAPMPGPEPQPYSGGVPLRLLVLLLIGGGLGGVAAIAATLTIRHTIKIRRRKEWQQKAKKEKVPDTCQPPQHYCEVETEIELKMLNVTEIDLAVTDARTGNRKTKKVKGNIPRILNQATRVRLKHETPEQLGQWINELASETAGEAAALVYQQASVCHLSMGIHLEGIEVTSTFRLYRCVKKGQSSQWKQIDLWKDKRKEQRDEPLAMFNSIGPEDTTLNKQIADGLKEPFRKFIADYQVTIT
ncbi:MAG: hypothetical protein JXJ17_05300 [Anaerolineae bacterium]|nr:hypothetical protein [Anaerolineae bacterium]